MSNIATDSPTIESAAHQLAAAIKTCSEWDEFQRINQIFENDDEITNMLSRYRELAAQIQGAHSRGEQTAHELRQLEHLQIQIQQNPLFQQREEAADAMLALLKQANAALTLDLGLDFAENARNQDEGGCCGGNGGGSRRCG